MSDSDNYVKILEKLSEVREDTGILKNETQHLKADICEVKKEVAGIREQDTHQNRLLDEHIQGVMSTNKRLDLEIQTRTEEKSLRDLQIKEIDSRLKRAEEIPDAIHGMKKFLQWFSVVITGLVALAEYIRHLHP
jgi:predicted nuclease with TOPRIM domain